MSDEPEVVGKRERQEALVASIVAGQQPEPAPAGTEARARLEALLEREELKALDRHLLAIFESREPQEPSFLEALAADARSTTKRHDRRGARPAAGCGAATRATSFDGGVRQTPPPPSDPERDHGELLIAAARIYRHGRGSENAGGEFAF